MLCRDQMRQVCTLKSSLGVLNRRRRVWAAWVARDAGGLATCSAAGRLGLPVSEGLLEP